LAIGDLKPETGEREVFMELNGQLRSISVKDKDALKVSSKSNTFFSPLIKGEFVVFTLYTA